MSVFLINAMAFAFVAAFWNKQGLANVLATTVMACLAVLNAALAAPALTAWIN